MSQPKASVIILAWNGMGYLEASLNAVLAQDYDDFEVVVVDNGSTDGSPDFVARRYPQVHLIRSETNLGFSAGNNLGMQHASGEILVLLNQDTVVQQGWLAALVAAFERRPDAGIVGSKILEPDGQTLQHAGGHIERPLVLGQHYGHGELDEGQYDEPCQVEYVTGAAMALRRDLLSKIGNLDEGFYPGYFEDVDFCLRARAAGCSIWFEPQAVLHHHESASMRRDSLTGHYYYYRNRLRFVLKHLTPEQFIEDFVPAELTRSAGAPAEEQRALALGAIEALTIWPFMARRREPPPTHAEFKAVLNALRKLLDIMVGLEQHAASTMAGVRKIPQMSDASDGADAQPWELGGESRKLLGSQPYSQLRHELESLDSAGQVTPRSFTSQVPILGPLIVAVRNFVNNLATRWYVQALLDQQVAFNADVTRVLAQTSLMAEHQSGFLAENLAGLQWQVLALEARVAELEEELERRTRNTTDHEPA